MNLAAIVFFGYPLMFWAPVLALALFIIVGIPLTAGIVKGRTKKLKRLTTELQVERDEITAMKDNLKTGIFLLNSNNQIEPNYSKALETILQVSNLEGRSFSDLLYVSLSSKEKQALEDYLVMVINRQFDAKMLEEINPINEFTYMNDTGEVEKILRSSFVPVDRGGGEYFVLGTLDDVTAEKELERQLKDEESKKDSDMKALFQVIKLDPRVFNDFLEDSEYEFNRINGILKNKQISSKEAMVRIYQCVHAIKSNALILGLERFSGQLHALESEIKKLQDGKSDVSFSDVLHITVELESVMRENDKLRDMISNIQSFMGGEARKQDKYVLVETLKQAASKAAEATGKKALLNADDVDGDILENAPRRVIKEILTQLVRNSVTHGIETPAERRSAGKAETGRILLSLKKEGERLHIRLTDDGSGLDFTAIKQKALQMKLIRNPAQANDRNYLLQVIFSPGFTTTGIADSFSGRGMGLSLVRDRVRQLKGSIRVQTEEGKGMSFHIFLPMEKA
jgi:two-component system chemotaxis sensor kinase CheA